MNGPSFALRAAEGKHERTRTENFANAVFHTHAFFARILNGCRVLRRKDARERIKHTRPSRRPSKARQPTKDGQKKKILRMRFSIPTPFLPGFAFVRTSCRSEAEAQTRNVHTREARSFMAEQCDAASYCDASAEQCFICQGEVIYEAVLSRHEAFLRLTAKYEALCGLARKA